MKDPGPCDVCHLGTLRPQPQTYATWYDGYLVLLPDANAWLCDVCGEFFYDPTVIARIGWLLGAQQPTRSSGTHHDRTRDVGAAALSSGRRRSA